MLRNEARAHHGDEQKSSARLFIGALFGPWIARTLGLPEPFMVNVDGHSFPILWSIIGAALCVAILHLFSRRR